MAKVDFSDDLPPEISDGEYTATCAVKVTDPAKLTKNGDEMAFIEFAIIAAADVDNEECVGRSASKIFMPRAKKKEGKNNLRSFRFFMQDVKELCAAFDVTPPSIDEEEVGTMAAWRPFLADLDGREVRIFTEAKKDKTGEMRINVRFSPPKVSF